MSKTIFVVDDEEVISTTLALILRGSGFYARSFVDPKDALRAVQTSAPDLLITDVMMPGINGIDLAIQVSELSPDCKILLFSGQAATHNLYNEAKSKGHHFELLAKPVHPGKFLEKINEMFEDSVTQGD